ncbi:MAG: pyrroline-5-carboxylate reductase [Desulfomonile tiedjei]|nr:pyrroline-5-carboxylate reductase [Desulfomonile tiedjei]
MAGIAVIGAGNMGAALIRGLVESGKTAPEAICVFDVDESKSRAVESELGVRVAATAKDALAGDTKTLVLAVKPQVLGGLLDDIADAVQPGLIIVSIAAGIPTEFILSHLKGPARVIRAMPNAAAMVGASATAICKGGIADDSDLAEAEELFSAIGLAVPVPEKMMNVVTALSGSGPGYLFPIMEAFTDGAVLMGLDRATARALTVQTFIGAGAMAICSDVGFSGLKELITSPGGTTIAGLQVLERGGLRGILMDAVAAATRRAEELGRRK